MLVLALLSLAPPQSTPVPKPDVLGAPTRTVPSTWPRWRGPNADGQFTGPAWPDKLDEGSLELDWQVPELGSSYSIPIVTDSTVFSFGTRDEEEEVVRAYNRSTGEELWVAHWSGSMEVPFFAAANGSWVRSTPAYDGSSLYVGGILGVLVCLNAEDGSERWRVDFHQRHGSSRPMFGMVCSPLVDGGAVYIQEGSAIEKLDAATGESIWRSMAGEAGMDSPFSSPILTEVHGERLLIVQTREHMTGVDPRSG